MRLMMPADNSVLTITSDAMPLFNASRIRGSKLEKLFIGVPDDSASHRQTYRSLCR